MPAIDPASPTPAQRALRIVLAPILRLMPEISYYTVVSAIALAVDIVLFTSFTRSGMDAGPASVIGYGAGLVLHYLLSSRYVFDTSASSKSQTRRFSEFVLSGGVGIALTWGILTLTVDMLGWPALLGKAIAVAIGFIVVFILRKGIVFAADRLA